jgi:hypothetical protein
VQRLCEKSHNLKYLAAETRANSLTQFDTLRRESAHFRPRMSRIGDKPALGGIPARFVDRDRQSIAQTGTLRREHGRARSCTGDTPGWDS